MAKQSKKNEAAAAAQSAGASDLGSDDAIALLTADHRKVEQLFTQFKGADEASEKESLARQVCQELVVHTLVEEEIFYPACRTAGIESETLDEAQVEHDGAKVLIADIQSASAKDEYYDAKLQVLSEYIKHHVNEEEKSGGIFAKIKSSTADLKGLGLRIKARKEELLSRHQHTELRPSEIRSIDGDRVFHRQRTNREEDQQMNRQYERSRDQYGRFESDEDPRSRSRFSSRVGYREDDERDHGSGRGEGGRGRIDEPEGYSGAADQDWGERGGGSGRGYARNRDDDERSGGRGWYGDPEGHSEASERGWEDRGRSRGEYASRSDDEDDRRSGRGQGWHGDSRGHSEAAERGWESRGGGSRRGYSSHGEGEDEDYGRRSSGGRGHGGWFGDPEGHSDASERGWEYRGGGSRRGYASRDREEGNGGRSSRSVGGGRGWYGDPEGHSRASERGWEHRSGGGPISHRGRSSH